MASGAQTTGYQYDALGNLVSVTLPVTQITYLTDGWNRRVGKRINGMPVQGFLYQNALQPVAELDGSSNVVSVFVYGTRDTVPDYMNKSGVRYRIISDLLGSPRLVVNSATGQVMQRMDYDAFGRVLTDTKNREAGGRHSKNVPELAAGPGAMAGPSQGGSGSTGPGNRSQGLR